MKPGKGIIEHLKNQGRDINELPLNVLREFQEFEKMLASTMDPYEDRPEEIKYGIQSFTSVEMLAIALFMTEDSKFSSVRRCHDDIMLKFKEDSMFDDGITLMNWIIFNFPSSEGGTPIANELLKAETKILPGLVPFIKEGLNSRFGMYEILADKKNSCHIKEVITEKEYILNQTLGGIPKGNLALIRVMNLLDKLIAFGGTIPEFPKEKKEEITVMIVRKMLMYFGNKNPNYSYETMMRLAGPYWFSIVARDYTDDILNPDYYTTYYSN
ncbi:MAG: hypothetical protein HQK49_08100 [Oligoflexia bacterium]|nr:hypothetical protein [Oligoflexia bacterium]